MLALRYLILIVGMWSGWLGFYGLGLLAQTADSTLARYGWPASGAQGAFHKALLARDYAALGRFLELGAQVNTPREGWQYRDRILQRPDTLGPGMYRIVKTYVRDSQQVRVFPIHDAVSVGDTQLVKWLVGRGAELDRVNGQGELPLALALSRDDWRMLAVLLKAQANARRLPEQGMELWRKALTPGNQPVEPRMRLLLAYLKPLDLRDSTGQTVTHYSTRLTDLALVRALLEAGAPLDEPDNEGNTPLLLALQRGAEEMGLMLLQRGANPFRANKLQQTALALAAGKARQKVMAELFNYKVDVRETDAFGNTALHYAARNAPVEVVKLLLDRGAAINQANTKGTTPLIFAAQTNEPAVVELLLTRGAAPLVRDSMGITPLLAAAAGGNPQSINAILKRRPELNDRSRPLQEYPTGLNAVQMVILANSVEGLKLLIREGISLKQRDEAGGTLLHFAARNLRVNSALLRELVRMGLNVNEPDNGGSTALHLAALADNTAATLALLSLGANPNLPNESGRSAKALARSPQMRRLLGE